ncbi:MAG: hypothetical protein PHO37_11770 [Kiritimatiellae bacterium]|nr:hypothetical protein [Kiritimatiellia bacterium]
MFKKTIAVLFLLTAVIVLAETFAKETPFVKKANAFVTTCFNKIYEGPVEAQWNKLRGSIQRVKLRASRKKQQEEALKTPPAPTHVKKTAPPAPPPPCPAATKQSPKTGIKKSSSKKLWRDDKGVYDWKNKKKADN